MGLVANVIHTPPGVYTVTVTNVTATGYEWDGVAWFVRLLPFSRRWHSLFLLSVANVFV